MPADLTGFTVAVTADRRADEQVAMLRRLGVDVVHEPTIRTLPVTGGDALRCATDALVRRPPQVLVATTSLGIRSWLGLASTWGIDGELVEALRATRIVARGPKAAGAVATAGLDVAWRADGGRLAEVTERLLAEGVAGARVAVQLDGDGTTDAADRLRAARADVVELPIYRWTLPERRAGIERLVERLCAGGVDAVTFTAGPAVRNLFAVAADLGATDGLRAALAATVVACIGPVCADAARAEGVAAPVEPPAWRLGSLVRVVGDELDRRRLAFRAADSNVVVQGSVVVVDGTAVVLTDRERALLHALVGRHGAVASRHELLREVWGGADGRSLDTHALDTVVSRLRAKLGTAGPALVTVVRRGYRWDGQPRR